MMPAVLAKTQVERVGVDGQRVLKCAPLYRWEAVLPRSVDELSVHVTRRNDGLRQKAGWSRAKT